MDSRRLHSLCHVLNVTSCAGGRNHTSCREVSEIPQGKHFGLDFVISQKLVQKRAASACLQWSQGGLVGTVWAGDVASLETSKS